MHQTTHGSAWKSLYWVGGVTALLAAIVFRRNLSAEFSLLRMTGVFSAGPTEAPRAAADWFALLQSNPLIGLTYLDLFDLANYMLVGLIYLALYPALRQINAGWMTLATVPGLMGVVVYLAANQAFAMLTLSDRYAAATTDAQRVLFVAAGEALLASYQGSGIPVSLLLVTLGGLIIALLMLRSRIYRHRGPRHPAMLFHRAGFCSGAAVPASNPFGSALAGVVYPDWPSADSAGEGRSGGRWERTIADPSRTKECERENCDKDRGLDNGRYRGAGGCGAWGR